MSTVEGIGRVPSGLRTWIIRVSVGVVVVLLLAEDLHHLRSRIGRAVGAWWEGVEHSGRSHLMEAEIGQLVRNLPARQDG